MAQQGRYLGRSHLPPELTSFIGRRQELREVKRLLGTTRLLPLTGSGGAGKTRLALRAAADMHAGSPTVDGLLSWLTAMNLDLPADPSQGTEDEIKDRHSERRGLSPST